MHYLIHPAGGTAEARSHLVHRPPPGRWPPWAPARNCPGPPATPTQLVQYLITPPAVATQGAGSQLYGATCSTDPPDAVPDPPRRRWPPSAPGPRRSAATYGTGNTGHSARSHRLQWPTWATSSQQPGATCCTGNTGHCARSHRQQWPPRAWSTQRPGATCSTDPPDAVPDPPCQQWPPSAPGPRRPAATYGTGSTDPPGAVTDNKNPPQGAD